jgi:hypothetical protein
MDALRPPRRWRPVSAACRNVTGFISAGSTVFWNVEKK